MEFLVNDLSLHGQYPDIRSFKTSIDYMLDMRNIAGRYGREIACHRNILSARIVQNMLLQQVIQHFDMNKKRLVMSWFTTKGPFWEDTRKHDSDDYIDHNGNIVTDTALGEAAWCCYNGMDLRLVSFSPSDWKFSPIPTVFHKDDIENHVNIENYHDSEAFEKALIEFPAPLSSWIQLQDIAIPRNNRIVFAPDAFQPLQGHPFSSGAAERLLFIFSVLNKIKSCFDGAGKLNAEGHRILKDFFHGSKDEGGRGAMFSDSSDSEKNKFKKEMTFRHPDKSDETLFCTWHGKIQTPQLRVHFSWPARADEPLYVVYAGPKITKG